MPWVKLDDNFPDHPKITQAGPLAGWLFVCGLAYCNRLLTDGYIPAGQVRKLADVDDPLALAGRLVDAGLWEVADGGYRVHDYLDYQPSREKAQSISEVRAQVGRKGGQQKASNLLERGQALASDESLAKSYPVPDPVPVELRDTPDELNPPTPQRTRTRAALSPAAAQLISAMCDELGADEAELSASYKARQGKVATRLVRDKYSEDQVRRNLRYLRSQTWRTGPIDLDTVEREIGKWVANGSLAAEPASQRRAPPNGKPGSITDIQDGNAKFLEMMNGHRHVHDRDEQASAQLARTDQGPHAR